MITKHAGGEFVKGGIYWSITAGEFISVHADGDKLPGGPRNRYIRAPLPIVLMVAPVLGLAFAIFLPLSGVLVLVPFLAGKLRAALSSGKVGAANMASSRVQPGVSYLEPSRSATATAQGPEGIDGGTEQGGKLVDLAKEIAEKRWQDKSLNRGQE